MKILNKIITLIKKLFYKNTIPNSSSLKKINFNASLIKMQLTDFWFTEITLSEIKPNNEDVKIRVFDVIDLFENELSTYFKSEIVHTFVMCPFKEERHYKGFVYLKNKDIVPVSFSNKTNIEQWNKVFLKNNYAANDNIPKIHKLISSNDIQGFFEYGELKNIGYYLVQYAPNEFKVPPKDIELEKQNYLQRYINTQGAPIDIDHLKTQFTAYLNKNNLNVTPSQNNEAIYQEFEKLAQFPIPNELKALFELHNGIENKGFLSAAQVVKEWKSWKTIFDDYNWTLEYLTEHHFSDKNKTLGIYTTPYWIPFYNLEGGNFYAIDLVPNKNGKSGQIIRFGADVNTIFYITSDITHFMTLLVNEEISH